VRTAGRVLVTLLWLFADEQFVWRVHQQRVIIPDFNEINMIKELLNVNFCFRAYAWFG